MLRRVAVPSCGSWQRPLSVIQLPRQVIAVQVQAIALSQSACKIGDNLQLSRNMDNPLRIFVAALFCVQLSLFSASAQQNEADYKKYVIYNPEPVIPTVVLRNGWGGHIVCVLTINPKNGAVDQVKVVRHTGHAKLDAIMVLTLFSWKFRPGTITHIKVGYTLGIYGRGRDLH